MYNKWPTWLLLKPLLIRIDLIRRYHTLGDCLNPYKVFLSLHTNFFLFFCTKPYGWSLKISTYIIPLKNVVFTSIWWISKFMAAPNARMYLIVINLATGANVALKSIMVTWEYTFATNRALHLANSTNVSFSVRNTQLHPTFLRPFGSMVNSHVPLAMSESYFSCIAAYHLLASSDLNASHKFKRLSNNATFVHFSPCWGKIWFFHHFLGGHCSLLGYHPSLLNLSSRPSFSTSNALYTQMLQTKYSIPQESSKDNQITQIRYSSPQMFYIFKCFKSNFVHIKKFLKTLKSVKQYLLHLKCLTLLNTSNKNFYPQKSYKDIQIT